jgi:hypothetical protein
MKGGYLQISFAWLFAIIVGAFILFLAIFISVKIINTEEEVQTLEVGKEIGILTNPLEMGFESLKSTSFTIPTETRIFTECNNEGNFGRQLIQISQKSFSKWTETENYVGFSNKYIFSENLEGKKFYLFSKQFSFPFKVADLIYMTSDNYCFSDAPEEIKDELESTNQDNFFTEDCPENSIEVCFENSCEINVNYAMKYVEKKSEKMYFDGEPEMYGDALMYAAIFSGPEVYECQLKRLMQRTKQLSEVYNEKSFIVAQKECNSNLENDLNELKNRAESLTSSTSLNSFSFVVDDLEKKNDLAECRLW